MSILGAFLDVLFPPRDTELRVRNATINNLSSLIAPTVFEGVVALLPYRHPLVEALIKEAKYKGNERAQKLLGEVLAEYLLEYLSERPDDTFIIVPIPLSAIRRRERGYNQTEKIAEEAGKRLSIPLSIDTLYRTRDTAPQTTLSKKERLLNMKRAFEVQNIDPSYVYIVVDDVLTTGATLREAEWALSQKGARQVLPIALAH